MGWRCNMASPYTNGVHIPSPEEEIAWLVSDIRQMTDEMEALDERVHDHKDRLRTLLEARGENWSDDRGYARLMADSTRTSYDAHALDQLIIADPTQHGWLKDYRKQFAVRGGIQVK